MIICVSANPAIDRRLRLRTLNVGEINRVQTAQSFAGGKAAHVALAARNLGEKNVIWIGFLGGSTGNEIETQLKRSGIRVVAVRTKSATRVNNEIIEENGRITEILEPGEAISPEEIKEFYAACEKVFANSKTDFQAVFSGSLPPNAPPDFYKNLILSARENGGKTLLDTSGAAFLKALEAVPGLIKPNAHEAENVLNLKIENIETARQAVKRFLDFGIENAVISLGADGLIWTEKTGATILAKPPKIQVNSTVGCGDSTVAGFAVAARRGLNISEKLRLAVACGAANCLADLPAQIKLADVEKLLPLVLLESD